MVVKLNMLLCIFFSIHEIYDNTRIIFKALLKIWILRHPKSQDVKEELFEAIK